MDAPEHTRYRRLLTSRFTVLRMRELEPRIGEIVDDLLQDMERSGPSADLVSSFVLPLPSLVICELLGIPYSDHTLFQELTEAMLALGGDPDRPRAASVELTSYLDERVARARREGGPGLIGDLIAAGELTDEEVRNIAMVLLVAGHDTTTHMLSLSTFALLEHPGQLAALRTDPELIGSGVEELLRYLSVLHYGGPVRGALEDVTVAGTRIRRGESVVISLPAVNRDPAVFDDPDALLLDRPNARRHLALGHGIHQCLGQQLARIELRIALPALFDRFPELRLAVPAVEVPLRYSFPVYGLWRLPVEWGPRP
jgi:cytochrome P450